MYGEDKIGIDCGSGNMHNAVDWHVCDLMIWLNFIRINKNIELKSHMSLTSVHKYITLKVGVLLPQSQRG